MDKVCIYLRKSREDEELEKNYGEGETLAKHRKALLRYAKEKDLNISKIYEEVVSGEKLIHRPEMLKLLQDVEEKKFDAVLVMDMQRLGRGDMQDQGLILNTFKESKTKIITLTKTYDLDNEFDEEYSEFEAFMSRKEYKMIKRRLQSGRVRSVQEGNYLGTYPPYGYVIEDNKQYRTLSPHPEQADIVKMIFDMYINSGMGGARIASKLNELGYRSYTGNPWERTAIINIIRNQVYIGKVVWKKKCINKSTTPGKKKDSYTRPSNEWIVADGKHPAIIKNELFDRAQRILATKYHPPYQLENGLQNPLAGLIICKKCGYRMKKRPYINGGSHIICGVCDNKSSRLIHVENKILDALEQWINGYELELDTGNDDNSNASQLQAMKKGLSNLEKEIDNLTKQKLNLHDLLEQGVYDVNMFVERSNNINKRIEETASSIIKLKEAIENETRQYFAKNHIVPKVKNVLDLYKKSDNIEEKNALLKSILEKVEYWKEKSQKNDDFEIILYPKTLE